jgi:sugar/nucleoside kinase (ribokinase family)
MFDVVTIGAATLDVFLQSSQFKLIEQNGGLALCERYNEKVDVEQAMITSGGAATNVAVGLARLGLKVGCIAEVGKDVAGSVVLSDLQREGVSTDLLVQEKSEETGVSGLLISKDGARTALVYRGAARLLSVSDVDWNTLQTKWVHLSSVGNVDLIYKALAWAKEYGAQLSWNPGNWEIQRVATGELKPDWSAVSVLLVNRQEFSVMTGVEQTDGVWASDLKFDGPQAVIVTDGAQGGKYCVEGKTSTLPPKHITALQETAGDAFVTGVIAGYLHDNHLRQASNMV